MLGSSSFDRGASSSSSSLSALAPPFTVVRTTSNPLLQFPDSSITATFRNTWQFSQPSATGSDYFLKSEGEVDSTRTTSRPLSSDYHFMASESLDSQGGICWSPNYSGKCSANGFSFGGDAQSFYSPYASMSPLVSDDRPLVAVDEPGHNVLQTPELVPPSVSSHIDYTESLSGLDYPVKPQWSGVWTGLADGKMAKGMDGDGRLSYPQANFHVPLLHKNRQGGFFAEFGSTSGENFDILYRDSLEMSIGDSQRGPLCTGQREISSVPENPKSVSHTGTPSVFEDFNRPHLSLESPMNFQSYQEPFGPPDNSTNHIHSSINGPIQMAKSTPVVVIRPPADFSSSSARTSGASRTLGVGNVSAVQIAGKDRYPKGKEPHPPFHPEVQEYPSVTTEMKHKELGDHLLFASAAVKEKFLDHVANDGGMNKVIPDCQAPSIRVKKETVESQLLCSNVNVDGSDLCMGRIEASRTADNSSDCLDHHGSSVDSPCWKGAPVSHNHPFDVASMPPDQLMKRSEEYSDSELVSKQKHALTDGSPCTPFVQSSGESVAPCAINSAVISCEGAGYSNFSVKGDAAEAIFGYTSHSVSRDGQFSVFSSRPMEYDLMNRSSINLDLRGSCSKQLSLEADKLSPAKINIDADLVETGIGSDDSSECGFIALRAAENVLHSPCSQEDAAENSPHCRMDSGRVLDVQSVVNAICNLSPCSQEDAPEHSQQCRMESGRILDVQSVVNAICNLSELLLFHCSANSNVLKGQDHEALKHVMNNLDAFLRKNDLTMSPEQKSCLPEHVTSDEARVLDDLHMGSGGIQVQLTRRKAGNLFSGEAADNYPHFDPLRNDLAKDDMAQAMKKVFNEHFHCKEGMPPEAILFKDLWLEAEAKVCSLTYRARFDHMKSEMEKCKKTVEKGNSANAPVPEKPASTEAFSDIGSTAMASSNIENASMLKSQHQDSFIPRASSSEDDIETSVMARFHILKCRGDDSSELPNNRDHNRPDILRPRVSGEENRLATGGEQSQMRSPKVTMESSFVLQNVNKGKFGSFVDDFESESVKEFHLHVDDDPAIQSSVTAKPSNQVSPRLVDNSSSDWEHVLTDDLTWQT